MKKQSQNSRILAYLQAGHAITPLVALELFGCMRLSARIHDLKDQGHDIKVRMAHYANDTRFAVYSMPAK